MTPELIREGAAQLLPYMQRQRSGVENDLSTLGSDPYKPFYGALATLLAPGSFLNMVLMGHVPTLDEAKAICNLAHPWFRDALTRSAERFEATYTFIYEAWY